MESQNLLIAALANLVKFQSSQCPTAKERALVIFERIAESANTSFELKTLCIEMNDLLIAK